MTEDEIVGWQLRLNECEFEQTQGDSEGQKSRECCSSWGHKELDMTEQLNDNKKTHKWLVNKCLPLQADNLRNERFL